MEKATLHKSGKGWDVHLESGKKFPLNWSQIPEDWNGKNVELLREKGQVKEIHFEGKIISHSPVNKPEVRQAGQFHAPANVAGNRARSPYNFIPLNEKPVAGIKPSGFETFDPGRFSGSIELDITSETPLFIRGNKERFLEIGGQPLLPGSSLRGLVRTLTEIVSFGKFEQVKDRYLYHRIPGRGATTGRMLGFLIRENDEYFILEAHSGFEPVRLIKEFTYEFKREQGKSIVYIFSGKMARNNFKIEYKGSGKRFRIDQNVIKSYEEDETRNAKGMMENLVKQVKDEQSAFKNLYRVFEQNNPGPTYLGIPVWYQPGKPAGGGEVLHFGHCRNYRVPYPLSIAETDHIPAALREASFMDFAESIFGTTERAGRVYFHDARLGEEFLHKDIWETREPVIPKILSSPKPTSYQLYLEQGDRQRPEDKLDWGDKHARIRGYKQYWHRVTPTENDGEHTWVEYGNKTDSHAKDPIRPVKKGVLFKGKIRFDNLTKEELGGLLFVLDLPSHCRHKLGMAKPLGLGSVHIQPTLSLIDRAKRYNSLFKTDGSWELGLIRNEGPSIQELKDFFAAWMIRQAYGKTIPEKDAAKAFWGMDRIINLRDMLHFDPQKMASDKWLNETRYMSIDHGEFRNRDILPDPGTVKRLGGA